MSNHVLAGRLSVHALLLGHSDTLNVGRKEQTQQHISLLDAITILVGRRTRRNVRDSARGGEAAGEEERRLGCFE